MPKEECQKHLHKLIETHLQDIGDDIVVEFPLFKDYICAWDSVLQMSAILTLWNKIISLCTVSFLRIIFSVHICSALPPSDIVIPQSNLFNTGKR